MLHCIQEGDQVQLQHSQQRVRPAPQCQVQHRYPPRHNVRIFSGRGLPYGVLKVKKKCVHGHCYVSDRVCRLLLGGCCRPVALGSRKALAAVRQSYRLRRVGKNRRESWKLYSQSSQYSVVEATAVAFLLFLILWAGAWHCGHQ